MKYQLTYVCPLCGRRLVANDPEEGTQEKSLEWVKRDIKYRNMKVESFLDYPEAIPHKCPDGSVGIARISGLLRVE